MIVVISIRNEEWDDTPWHTIGAVNADSKEALIAELDRVLSLMYATEDSLAEVSVQSTFYFDQPDNVLCPEETFVTVTMRRNPYQTETKTLDLQFIYTKFI